MTQIDETGTTDTDRSGFRPAAALACGILGVAGAVWVYWLILPGLVFGIAAIALGAWSRGRGAREVGSVAIALGIAAVLLVPSVLVVVDAAEDWGRDCALKPSNPDC
jgi:hypothetical protein